MQKSTDKKDDKKVLKDSKLEEEILSKFEKDIDLRD